MHDARNTTIAAEHRNNFGKRSSAASPSCAAKRGKGKATSWTHKFFCLSETNDEAIPAKKNHLILAGLGEKSLTIPNIDCSANDFLEFIMDEFPKLREGGGIEFLQCMQSSRKLEVIPYNVSSSPRMLKTWIGAARVYLRPIQRSLDLSPVDGHAMVSKLHFIYIASFVYPNLKQTFLTYLAEWGSLNSGVCKQWNGLLEWWNTGMVEWKFLKVYYEFLHLNLPPHTQEHTTTHTGVRLQAQLLVIIINNTYNT